MRSRKPRALQLDQPPDRSRRGLRCSVALDLQVRRARERPRRNAPGRSTFPRHHRRPEEEEESEEEEQESEGEWGEEESDESRENEHAPKFVARTPALEPNHAPRGGAEHAQAEGQRDERVRPMRVQQTRVQPTRVQPDRSARK